MGVFRRNCRVVGATNNQEQHRSILLPPYYLIENGQEKFLNKEQPSSHVNVGGYVLMFSYIVSRFCSLVSTDGLFGFGRKF